MSSGRGPARRAQHLIRDVCHARGLDHTRALELDRVRAEVVEQTHTAPEQDRDDVQVQLVEKACPRALLHGGRPHYTHVPLTGCGLGLVDRTLDAVGDVGVRRVRLNRSGFAVGEDEEWHARQGTLPPQPSTMS